MPCGTCYSGGGDAPKGFSNELLNDSKLLSHKNRDVLRPLIESGCSCFGVAHVPPSKIDSINILNASFLAMHKALDQLSFRPELILVDGNRFHPYNNIRHECIVKGDSKFMSIAAASVLAKTHRDAIMEKLHAEYPMYNWKKNKGYPTKEHREAFENTEFLRTTEGVLSSCPTNWLSSSGKDYQNKIRICP